MKYLSVDLRVVSPLALRADHAPKGARTSEYIPGTVFMGSLAAAHRLLYPEQKGEFEALFLSEQIHYPNLYPAVFTDAGMQESGLPVYPFPQTARTCKRFPGFQYVFPGEEEDEERHGVVDTLIDWALFRLSGDANASLREDEARELLTVLEQHQSCQHNEGTCNAAMDDMDGYYRRDSDQNMIAAQPAKSFLRLQTYTGINRDLGIVEESILYNREVFEEGTRFWGVVKMPDDEELAKVFVAFVNEADKAGLIRVGTGRTRGLGKVHIVIEDGKDGGKENEQHTFPFFKERLMKFHNALVKRAENQIQHLNPFYFALTLHSPLILTDELLRYFQSIDGETLARLTGLPSTAFTLIYQAASGQRIAGWNGVWGLPRTAEYAIDTGSTFLFASSLQPEDAVIQQLFDLEEQDIGRRRAEGFGHVCFSDPFHSDPLYLEGEFR